MNKQIKHIGTVVRVGEGEISVLVERGTACKHCENKKSCSMTSEPNQIVTVKDKNYQAYAAGETVNVSISTSLGMKAVVLAYLLPLLVLMLSLVLGFYCFSSELLQIVFALIPTVSYYIVLYQFRHKIEQRFRLMISKI